MGVPGLLEHGTKPSILPGHILASPAALAKCKAISEKSKTQRVVAVSIGDSNHTPGNFMSALWERDNFARILDQQLAWMRGNVDNTTSEILGPQTQVIKFSTMGNATTNSPSDTPWHPNSRKVIGDFRVTLGPFGNSYKVLGGTTVFSDGSLVSNRFIGLIIDRTSTGQDWERNVTQAAVAYHAVGPGQTCGCNSGGAVKANGATYTDPSYSRASSSFTLCLKDISSVDLSGIPATGWDEADSACIAIKTAILAIANTSSVTINPNFGTTGSFMPGYLSSWLTGMTSGKKWCVCLTVADGASNGGTIFDYLLVDNGSITGGVSVLDFAYSGNALSHCEWRRTDVNGNYDATWGKDPFTGDVIVGSYVAPSLASRTLMLVENTYGLTGYFGASGWATAGATRHNPIGLDIVVLNLLVNDVNGTSNMPTALQVLVSNACSQVARANPNAVVFVNLPPCPGFSGGDNVRDNWYYKTGGARASDAEFRAGIRSAVSANSSNTILLDYQSFYGNIAPTVLKSRIGHFGNYKRQSGDPIDVNHFKTPTWQMVSARDIANVLQSYSYR